MKKYLTGIVAIILLCLSGCGFLPAFGDSADQNATNSDIRNRLNESIAEAIAQSLSPDPAPAQTPKETERIADQELWDHWAQKLEGWWVDLSSYGIDEYVSVNYFAADGTVYLSPEDYWRSQEDAVTLDVWQWTLEEGQPYLVKPEDGADGGAPLYGALQIDEFDGMFVEWLGDDFKHYERNTGFWATNFLLDGPYYYLAESARLAWVRFGENLFTEEGNATIWVDEVTWVNTEEYDLIKEYGLEDAPFNNDYELYNPDTNYYPMQVMIDGMTTFRVCDYNDEGFLIPEKKVDFYEFKKLVDELGEKGMLVYYGGDEGLEYIFSITQRYIP